MNITKTLSVFFVLFLFFPSSGFAPRPLDRSEIQILGISIGTSESALIKSLGAPTKIVVSPTFAYPAYGYQEKFKNIYYKGTIFQVQVEERTDSRLPKKISNVTSIYLTDRSATTVRGLAVGDSESRVKELYGDDYKEYIYRSNMLGLCFDAAPPNFTYDKSYDYTSSDFSMFVVHFYKGRVVAIELG